MGRKNSPSAKKELTEIIQRYEAAKAEKRQLYLDGDQLADIADWYATERKSTMHRKSLITDFNCTPATLAY